MAMSIEQNSLDCMRKIICEIYWNQNDHNVKDLISNLDCDETIKLSSIDKLINLGLAEKYCFGNGINLTSKGLEFLHKAIEDGLKRSEIS